jgi:hypothetical protein
MNRWTKEFDEHGGYDCMTGAWNIYDPKGNLRVKVDLGHFGQAPCAYEFRSTGAEEVAECIVKALNARVAK